MLNVVALNGRLTHTPELKTTQNGTSVCNVSFCGSKAEDKPAVCDFDRQTESYASEAKASYSAPQAAQNFSQGSADDFAEITDDGDLQF